MEKYNLDIDLKREESKEHLKVIQYPLKFEEQEHIIFFRFEGKTAFYHIDKDGLETSTSIDFFNNTRKREQFFKFVFINLEVVKGGKKQELKKKLMEMLTKLQQNDITHTIKNELRNREQGKQGKQKQQQEKQQNTIHCAGGIYQKLVIEPLGDYRYLYNFKVS